MRRWGPFLLCCGLLAWGLFTPAPPSVPVGGGDKLAHLLGFLALGLSARYAFPAAPALRLWSFLLAVAPLLEWLQHQVTPVRHLSLGDALANILGVLLALLAWQALALKRQPEPQP